MSKEDPEGSEREEGFKIIANLMRSIEELVSGSKKSQQLEGILAEARALVQEWKFKEPSGRRRPLFDDTVNPTTLLLAGLVVALRRDHQLVEQIRRHFPRVLEILSSHTAYEDAAVLALEWESAQPKPTPGQLYERKRSARIRHRPGLIEREFGIVPDPFSDVSPLFSKPPPRCLDDIFLGARVNMLHLENLFGLGHNRFPKKLPKERHAREILYDFRAVVMIMRALLRQTRRKKKGRPRELWLNNPDDPELRTRVMNAIEQRMNSLSVREEIRGKFLSVVRRKAI